MMHKKYFALGMRVRYTTTGGNYPNKQCIGREGTVVQGDRERNGVWVRWDNDYTENHSPAYLIPVVDDFLPPAPESVMYFNSNKQRGNDQRLTVAGREDPYGEACLFVAVKIRTGFNYNVLAGVEKTGIGVCLDADAALQLASDLTRMAMQLKREQEK